jgi:hypothetical protein
MLTGEENVDTGRSCEEIGQLGAEYQNNPNAETLKALQHQALLLLNLDPATATLRDTVRERQIFHLMVMSVLLSVVPRIPMSSKEQSGVGFMEKQMTSRIFDERNSPDVQPPP